MATGYEADGDSRSRCRRILGRRREAAKSCRQPQLPERPFADIMAATVVMASFTHLHVHSEYSLLDGLIRLPELAREARQAGFPALALTDHGVMYGAARFYHEAQEAGIKPILGCELYVARRLRTDRHPTRDRRSFHLTVLAENETGYRNLLQLVSRAQLEGFYYKPRVDRELVQRYAEGLVVLSGCLQGELPQALKDGDEATARQTLAWYRDVFGDRYYLELQDHNLDELATVNRGLLALAREFEVPLVATNDVHYLRATDVDAHEVLIQLQWKSTTQGRERRGYGPTYHLRSADEMAALFGHVPEALANTMVIAERCNVDLRFGERRLPDFPLPEGQTADSYLRQLCEAGAMERYGAVSEVIRERLDRELATIAAMGFATYFLIVWDLCRHARERGIWYNVRGSGAGSVVAYALRIANIDPLAHGLIFERFLNPARVSMPDIDLDLADDQRDELIRYAHERYGQDHVAQIITFGTLGARAAIRDAGRALELPLSLVDRIARMIPAIPGKPCSLDQVLTPAAADDEDSFFSAELAEAVHSDPDVRRLVESARSLEGLARHASTHAAGVVITDRPIIEYLPLHRSTHGEGDRSGLPVTQYAMKDIERLGLLKIDFLGLSTLTVLRRAAELVAEHHGVSIRLESIPLDDPAIYELLGSGNVTGVFQVESAGMRQMLREMQPRAFEHVTAALALYRPGPMRFIPDYIRRMHGQEEVTYLHPALVPILAETYGILIYQEQIIRIAQELAGYEPGKADLIRRAVGKKNQAELLKHHDAFVEGATERGIERQDAERIFELITKFARYGFNKAHAADYAMIVCQTAWFKARYPIEYMTALLSVDRHNTDKVALIATDCATNGIRILPPDVNQSQLDFTVEALPHDGSAEPRRAIRFGLGAIKNVGDAGAQAILAGRGDRPFANLDDLCRRVDLRAIGKRALEPLVRAGALDCLGSRDGILELLDRIISLSDTYHHASAVGQMSLFGDEIAPALPSLLPEITKGPGDVRQHLQWEKELTGLYLSDHPLHRVAAALPQDVTVFLGDIERSLAGTVVTFAGMVTAVRTLTTKRGDLMAFVVVEDLNGSVELTVFPRVYEATKDLWRPDVLVLVRGKVEPREDRLQVVVASAQSYAPDSLAEVEEPGASQSAEPAQRPLGQYRLSVTVPRTADDSQDLSRLEEIFRLLTSFRGQDRFALVVPRAEGMVELEFPNASTRYCVALVQELQRLVGAGAVQVTHVAHGRENGP